MTVADRWKTWVEQKAVAGLCPRCGKRPVNGDKQCCSICLLDSRRRRTRLYRDRLRVGLCPHCGGKREDPWIIGCLSCREKIAVQRVIHFDRGKKALYQRRLLASRRREGMCPTCGQERDESAYKHCSRCREARRDYYYRHHEERKRYSRRRHDINYRPKPLCPVCNHHRIHCQCGKIMKTHHGERSCLYTCTCGHVSILTPVEVS